MRAFGASKTRLKPSIIAASAFSIFTLAAYSWIQTGYHIIHSRILPKSFNVAFFSKSKYRSIVSCNFQKVQSMNFHNLISFYECFIILESYLNSV